MGNAYKLNKSINGTYQPGKLEGIVRGLIAAAFLAIVLLPLVLSVTAPTIT